MQIYCTKTAPMRAPSPWPHLRGKNSGGGAYCLISEKKVLGGDSITIKDIQVQCEDHVAKQKAGMLSTTLTAHNDSGLGKLLQTSMEAPIDSEEWKAANEQVEQIRRRQIEKRVPDERHKKRMSALYVDAVAPDR